MKRGTPMSSSRTGTDAASRPRGLPGFAEPKTPVSPIDKPMATILAVRGRYGRQAPAPVVTAHNHIEAPVLGRPLCGDIEPRHELQAQCERRRNAQVGFG